MKKLCFHQILVTQEPEALRESICNLSRISQHANFDAIIQEQNLLRQLTSASNLPTIELEVSENDTHKTTDMIANWIVEVGGNIPPEDYAIDGVILPSVC